MRMFILLIPILFTGSIQSAHAKPDCSESLEAVSKTWRPGNNDVFMAFRSNAPHFWEWSKAVAAQKLPEALLREGIAAGDPHVLNFGQVVINDEKFALQLVDLDDAGKAPLIFDLLRLMVSVNVSPAKTKGKEIWGAYLKGLGGEDFKTPRFIKADDKLNVQEFLRGQQKLLQANVVNNKLNLAAYKLSAMKTAPQFLRATGDQIIEQLKKTQPELEFMDWGWRAHKDGGSQGMDRIWALFRQKNGNMILREFKQMAPPATGNYQIQADNETRINQVRRAFWRTSKTDEYEVVTVPGGQFLARDRYVYPLDADIKAAIAAAGGKLDDLSEYLGYQLGKLHAQQPAGAKLFAAIEKNDAGDVFKSLKGLRDDYVQLVKSLVKKER